MGGNGRLGGRCGNVIHLHSPTSVSNVAANACEFEHGHTDHNQPEPPGQIRRSIVTITIIITCKNKNIKFSNDILRGAVVLNMVYQKFHITLMGCTILSVAISIQSDSFA